MAVAAKRSAVEPLVARFVDDCETPVSAFLKLRAAFDGPAHLLESAEQGRLGRFSFLGFRPHETLRWSLGDSGDPYEAAARLAGRFRVAPSEGPAPFGGGAVGFFGYDLVRTVEALGEPNPDPLGLPDMALMVTDVMVAFDHLRHELTILACAFADQDGGIDAAYARATETIADVRERLRGPVPAPAQPALGEAPVFTSNMERGEFEG